MKRFDRDYNIATNIGEAYAHYFGELKPCVFDIEATGLTPSINKVVMTAMLIPTETGVRITQFLAENHYEEDRVLTATMEFLNKQGVDYLITYNGTRYDIPFVNTRLDKLCLPYSLDYYDLDLYRILRKYSNLPRYLDSLSQGSVERYFGIRKDREDTISGKESVILFDEYARTGNTEIEKVILTHNREDVLQLYKLLHAASYDEWSHVLDNSSFDELIASYGIPACKARFSARPVLSKSHKELKISGTQNYQPISAAYFRDIDFPITATFNSATKSFEIYVPLQDYLGSYFVDIKALGFEDEFQELDECVNDYLILNRDGQCRHRAIAELSKGIMALLSED